MTTEHYYHRKAPTPNVDLDALDERPARNASQQGLADRLMSFGRRRRARKQAARAAAAASEPPIAEASPPTDVTSAPSEATAPPLPETVAVSEPVLAPAEARAPAEESPPPPPATAKMPPDEVPDPAPKAGYDFHMEPLHKKMERAKAATAKDDTPRPAKTTAPVSRSTWFVLALIALVALALRLREPMSSPIMGAEDPYLHMERTWNLIQGQPIADYPPGLMVLLAPLTLLGPAIFYDVARWFPPFLGAGAVVAVFYLCRPYMHVAGALGASLLIAMMPEVIFRSNALMPTAFDLVIVPIFLLAVLRVPDGEKWALRTAGALALFLGLAHPWALVLVLVPTGVWGLGLLASRRAHRSWTVPAAAGGFLAFLILVNWLPVWRPTDLLVHEAFPRAAELMANPGSFWPAPLHVDLPTMLTWAALLLGVAGAIIGLKTRRGRFAMLAIVWCLLLLPLILVDWFDIWYVPHRTVAYFAIGLAMLAGIAISELVGLLETARPNLKKTATPATLALVAVLLLPGALSVEPWYRVYNDDDLQAWSALDARGTPFVMSGSWESRAGYRAITGNSAVYSPPFFEDEVIRNYELSQHPDMIVVIDNETERNGHPTEFLQSWELVGQWGDVRAYAPPRS